MALSGFGWGHSTGGCLSLFFYRMGTSCAGRPASESRGAGTKCQLRRSWHGHGSLWTVEGLSGSLYNCPLQGDNCPKVLSSPLRVGGWLAMVERGGNWYSIVDIDSIGSFLDLRLSRATSTYPWVKTRAQVRAKLDQAFFGVVPLDSQESSGVRNICHASCDGDGILRRDGGVCVQ